MAYSRLMALEGLRFGDDGLLTVVVQDRLTGEVRMLAHADADAVRLTLETSQAHFYSRSRSALWRKGESSGHTLQVGEVWADCDGDALLYLVDPEGPTCHTGRATCFFRVLEAAAAPREHATGHGRALLPMLWAELEARRDTKTGASYTRSLLEAGASRIADKIREEAEELACALTGESEERMIAETADVLYHLLVGLLARGVSLRDVEAELGRRFGVSGLTEQASRTKSGTP